MRKHLITAIMVIVIFFVVNTSAKFFLQKDENHNHLSHAAATDENGCHYGPTGFHCHR